MLGYIDTGVSNTGSVVNAFVRIGVEPKRLTAAEEVDRATALVLPGVGAFRDGMAALRERGLIEPIQRAAGRGVPTIGICLGMQFLADKSEEHGSHAGLGLVSGTVELLEADPPNCRVPNIGWSEVTAKKPGVLFGAGAVHSHFYFLHSYHLRPTDPSVVAATFPFGANSIVAAIESGPIFGIQFHPEKSQDAGLDLLVRFVDRARQSGGL
jgi:glutamine amidotransferase